MKRSQINYAIDKAHAVAETFRVCLPEFAWFTADIWPQKLAEGWQEVHDLQLGWDITDFGSGCFNETGLTLLTLRNGALNDARYPKPFAEKMLQIQQDQQTPWHFHYQKMEDIINRGGGDLCMQLAWATEDERLDDQRSVSVAVDGRQRMLKFGDTLVLKPGQGVCLPTRLYHRFWAEKGFVLGWEISRVNDDRQDNCFLQASGRFPVIQEDEPIKWLLCSEYGRL
ncbi:D-lyxose/D-mannose family sugar isomerase [Izhakiella australiensis]|uniref:D-lyxose ketol-isomerase n=1 Tax=Izhakiella australiensis TaxID=1926881 RepID=A0A1S8YU30_9GAMM|nr:D-lyxose/D-mannose family sugar isomerase [Izhakiella australiensis]OON42143.1 D-lyxose/D-mannose family sugar isomerase [Izhakiella australiensis]